MFNLPARRRSQRSQTQPALERLEDRTLLSSVIQTDSTFGNNGQLNVPTAVDAVVQNSGRILVVRPEAIDATHNTVVIQGYDVNGAIDTNYGTNGKAVGLVPSTSGNATPLFLVLRPDGGAFVVGQTQLNTETGQRYFIASVDSAGKIVSSHGFQGRTTLVATDLDLIVDATADNNGRLLLVRQSATTGGYYVQRFGNNGLPDSSFGAQGRSALPSTGLVPTDIIVHPNGTVLVSTTFGTNDSTIYLITFADANGQSAFPVFFSLSESVAIGAKLAIDSQGRILIAGQSQTETFTGTFGLSSIITSTLEIARYSANFQRDTTFSYTQNTSGAATGQSTVLEDLAVQADGKILVSLNDTIVQPAGRVPTILRLTDAGVPDVTFDDDGFFTPTFTGRSAGALQLLPLRDGRLLTMQPLQRPSVLLPPSILFSRYLVGTTPPTGRNEDLYIFDPTTGKLSVQISRNGSFVERVVGNWGADPNWDTVVGDFDGDARLDFAGRNTAGRWKVYLSSTGQTADWGNWNKDFAWQRVAVADFNGDGRDDIIGQIPAGAQVKNPDGSVKKTLTGGDWWVALSTGTRFVNEFFGRWQPEGWIDFEYGDFTGDGKADILGLQETGAWTLGIANAAGNHFNIRGRGNWAPAPAWQIITSGDFDNDGVLEIAGMQTNGNWWLGEFGSNLNVKTTFMNKWTNTNTSIPVLTGDFNGDGRTDILGVANNGSWIMTQGNGTTFQTIESFGSVPPGANRKMVVGDFNGDGLDDVATINPSNGSLHTSISTGSFFQQSLIGILAGIKTSTFVGAGEILP